MLPPVSPVSATDASFNTATPRQDVAPAQTTVTTTVPAEPPDAPNLASSTGIRAVSGELQLSKNVSVLAETLGKLLNIARMDGEAAEAYVNRLVENIKTLGPDQKANLEKALGSILRGISLDILASALKSSAGPEAARLAVLFELTRSGQAAPQNKPSVPTYLQDILPRNPEAAQSPNVNPARLPATLPTGVEKALAQMPKPEMLIAAEVKAGTPMAKPSSNLGQGADFDIASPAKPAMVAVSSNPVGKAAVNAPLVPVDAQVTTIPQPSEATSKPTSVANGQTAQTAAPQPGKILAPIIAQQLDVPLQETAEPPQGTPLPATPLGGKLSAVIANAFLAASPKEMEKLLLAAVLGKLPERAEVTTTQMPAGAWVEPELEHASKSQVLHTINPQTKAEQAAEDSLLTSQRPEMIAAQRTAVAHDMKAAILEQPTLHAAVAAMMAKEAAALPYVAYPSAKDEHESDSPPRGSWPSSQGDAEDADSGGEQPDHESSQEERTAANDEPIDHSVSEGANDDGSVGNAESYYLRMSGFS
ncbi:hypothetical protein [Agrobacterium sp. lyk4-40-TYG-31]|uniref:hypothetical protein n=1 Tax=Agrobacterium sp. lyk4-40-TYG-31 TaxID=3040276 RepID=UPI0025515DD5|nr:hypothetical protein [Agrobacterium sp. lyk4-40-TYG-31]